MNKYWLSISLFFLGLAFSAPSSAATTLTTIPGKRICHSQIVPISDDQKTVELCVTQGTFAHDIYALNIDGSKVLSGIDDETTQGITRVVNDKSWMLKCIPIHEKPEKIDPKLIDAYMKMIPGISRESAEQTAQLSQTVEVGRSCSVSTEGSPKFEILVKFE